MSGTPANVAMFAIANSTWTTVGDSSQIGGEVTALVVNNANSSSIFAAGPKSSGSFLSFWDGTKWSDVDSKDTFYIFLVYLTSSSRFLFPRLQLDSSAALTGAIAGGSYCK